MKMNFQNPGNPNFRKKMIAIPPPTATKSSYDRPNIVQFKIHSPLQSLRIKENTFCFGNDQDIRIPPKQWTKVMFNIVVFSSLPAFCLIYADQLIKKYHIYHLITSMNANDHYLYIMLYNNSNHDFFASPFQYQFCCTLRCGHAKEVL